MQSAGRTEARDVHLPYTFIEVDPRVHLVYFVHSQLQDPPLPLLARGLLLRDSQCAGRLDGGLIQLNQDLQSPVRVAIRNCSPIVQEEAIKTFRSVSSDKVDMIDGDEVAGRG